MDEIIDFEIAKTEIEIFEEELLADPTHINENVEVDGYVSYTILSTENHEHIIKYTYVYEGSEIDKKLIEIKKEII